MRFGLRSTAAAAALLALNACAAGGAPQAAAPPNDTGARGAMNAELAPPPPSVPAPATAPAPAGMDVAAAPTAAGPTSATRAKAAPADVRPTVEQMIVYTGRLSMLVDEAKESATLDLVIDAAEALGGHLDGRTNTQVVVKVPSAAFRQAMEKLEPLGEVVDRNVTAEDVTEQFHDAEVRLENLRATRARLQQFLDRAGNMQDALSVEHELERVAEEMDVLEGKLAFMKDRATWSQITVDVQPKPKVADIVKDPPPPPNADPRLVQLPVDWIDQIGIDRLLNLK